MSRKWRPPLWFVLGGGLAGTLLLSFIGLVVLRYVGPVAGFRQTALAIAIVIAALTTVLGWLLVRLLLRPINGLNTYAHAIREGHTVTPPSHYGTPELRGLAQSVVQMGTALRDREASIRTYSDHVTHELKTPVSALRAATELLRDGGGTRVEDRQILTRMEGALDQMEGQLAALRAMAAAREPGHHGTARLADLAEKLRGAEPGLELTIEGATLPLPLAEAGLHLVLGHLLANAAAHGADQVQIRAHDRGLTVTDNGPGVSTGNRNRMFEPFFTTRREDGGTGMGLAIVRAVLETHGWQIAAPPSETGLTLELTAP